MKKEEIKELVRGRKICEKSLNAISDSECVKAIQPTGYISSDTLRPYWEHRIKFVDGETLNCDLIDGEEDEERMEYPTAEEIESMSIEEIKKLMGR